MDTVGNAIVPIRNTLSTYERNKLAEEQLHEKFDEIIQILNIKKDQIQDEFLKDYSMKLNGIKTVFEDKLRARFTDPVESIHGFKILIQKIERYKKKYASVDSKSETQLLPLLKTLDHLLHEIFNILTPNPVKYDDQMIPPQHFLESPEEANLPSIMKSNNVMCLLSKTNITDIMTLMLISPSLYGDTEIWKSIIDYYKNILKVSIDKSKTISESKNIMYYFLFLYENNIKDKTTTITYDLTDSWNSAYTEYSYIPLARYWYLDHDHDLELDPESDGENIFDEDNEHLTNFDPNNEKYKPGDVIVETKYVYRNKTKYMIEPDAPEILTQAYKKFKGYFADTEKYSAYKTSIEKDMIESIKSDALVRIMTAFPNNSQLFKWINVISESLIPGQECTFSIDPSQTITLQVQSVEEKWNSISSYQGLMFDKIYMLHHRSSEKDYYFARKKYIVDLYNCLLDDGIFKDNVNDTKKLSYQNKLVELHRDYDDYGSASAFCPVITKYPINYWNGLNDSSKVQFGRYYKPIDHNEAVYCPFSEIFDEASWISLYAFFLEPSKETWNSVLAVKNQNTTFAVDIGPSIEQMKKLDEVKEEDSDDDDNEEEGREETTYPTSFVIFTYKDIKYALMIEGRFEEATYKFFYNIGFYNPNLIQEHEMITEYNKFPIIHNSKVRTNKKVSTLGILPTNMLWLHES